MKTLPTIGTLFLLLTLGHAASTVNVTNRFAYGANLGWCDFRADINNGAVVGEFVCTGFVYSANAGWINLGSGTPANGIRYLNNSSTDFGVNHDGAGNLIGYAWGANIGWITFTNHDASGAAYDGPKVDLRNGRLSGFAWSATCGWISVSNLSAFVQTDTIRAGTDTDADGIADAWERLYYGDLSTANSITDFDGDGMSDLQEYLAGTDPTNRASNLRITQKSVIGEGLGITLTWNSVPSREYRIRGTDDIADPSPWADLGFGLISPDAGSTTTHTFYDFPAPTRFFRIEAIRPLVQ